MPRWTDAYRLRNCIEAPMEAGLYEIQGCSVLAGEQGADRRLGC